MDTECSYDYVFVYDGDSYKSPLLGSFSGNTTPSHVTAGSGSMLILLYSDTNYVRTGFHAVYTITNCPQNCSTNGLCFDHHCVCDSMHTGIACDINLCPSDCGDSKDHGQCSYDYPNPVSKCVCYPGYSGMDCSLPDTSKNSSGSWHLLSPDDFFGSGRAGHSSVYIEQRDTLYSFGGYTFRKVLGDLIAFDFGQSSWKNLTVQLGPSPRRNHAAVPHGQNFILYGGECADGQLSDELWLFNTSSQSWRRYQGKSSSWPPPLSKHSLTPVDGHRLYLFGGALTDGTYSSDIYTTMLNNPVSWKEIKSYGIRLNRRKLVGHTAVFYEPARSIFVYGGATVDLLPHGSRLNPHIFAFHVDKHMWTRIHYFTEKNVSPLERAFHTAAIIGDYMVVFGGYTHRHSDQEICYDNATYLYDLRCHTWVDSHQWITESPDAPEFHANGLFAHSMAVRYGHTLLIHGGYSGIMHSRLMAYVLPSIVTEEEMPWYHCHSRTTPESCMANLACGWCFKLAVCMEKEDKRGCTGKMVSGSCQGICGLLHDCSSCVVWGDSAKANTIDDYRQQDRFAPNVCQWYVKGKVCLPYNGAAGPLSDFIVFNQFSAQADANLQFAKFISML